MREDAMTEERLVLAELLEKAGDGDFLRTVAEAVLQLLMESDVEGLIGAGRYERSGERTTWRNGYRDRTFDTRLGALQLRIPKLRQGSYPSPELMRDWKLSDDVDGLRRFCGVVMEAAGDRIAVVKPQSGFSSALGRRAFR